MRADNLKELLSMYPDDTEVMLQTTPDDLASPLTMKNFSLWKASHDARYGLEPEKLVLTAFIPSQPCTSHLLKKPRSNL